MTDDRLPESAGYRHDHPTAAGLQAARLNIGRTPEEPHLLEYLRIVVKRRRIVAAAFILVVALASAYTYTAVPIYESRAQLLIETDDPNIVDFTQVVGDRQGRYLDYYLTQYQLIESRSVARKAVDALGLWDAGTVSTDTAPSRFSTDGVAKLVVEWVDSLLNRTRQESVAVATAETPGPGETTTEIQAINSFLGGLSVAPVPNSRLVDVVYRTPDPQLAARAANAVATAYIEQNRELRSTATRDASSWLAEQLAQQRRSVEAAEGRLQRYREQNAALSFEDNQNVVVQKLTDLNAAVTRAKTDRLQKEAVFRQLEAISGNPELLETFPVVLANPLVQQHKTAIAQLQREQAQMAERLGDRHPEMIRLRTAIETAQERLSAEIAEIVGGVRTEYEAAVTQEQSLAEAFGVQRGEALAMNRQAIEYGVLERDVESSKQIYETLLLRTQEIGISGELRTSNVRLVDRAEVPAGPVSPRRAFNLLLGILGGLFAGIGLALFFEYLDNRVKSPEEIVAHLGLPSVGFIPLAPGSRVSPRIDNRVPPGFAEAFRTLRTNVLFSTAEAGCRSIVVTSAGPGEGKSVIAANLALGLALAGQRVLLIDADMRRPRSHDLFGVEADPGLSNALVGNTDLDTAIHTLPTPNLWVLTAGKTPPNPAELLASRRFAELLVTLGERFDFVIVDSPPVMAVTDAAIIANQASGVLFVVAADQTRRHVAQQAIDQLEQARARFVGAVLNRVDLDRQAHYYGRYYRKDYTAYYTSTSNTAAR